MPGRVLAGDVLFTAWKTMTCPYGNDRFNGFIWTFVVSKMNASWVHILVLPYAYIHRCNTLILVIAESVYMDVFL